MNTHGGKREGAGRKTGKTHKKVLISLPLAVAEWLEKKDNKSGYIAGLVEEKMNKTAREFLTYAHIELTEHSLYMLTQYVRGGDHDYGIDYSQFPDATIGTLSEDIDEPVNFQEYMAESGLLEDKLKTVLDVINEFDADVEFEYVSDIFGTDNRMFDKAMIIDAIKDLSENVNLLDKHPAYGLEIDEDGAVCGWFVTNTDIIYANRFRHETVWRKLPV